MLDQFLLWAAFSAQLAGFAVSFPPLSVPKVVEIARGSGRDLADGDIVTFHVVASTIDGKEIANSEKRGLPLRIKLGDATTPPYLDFSLRGMSLGGRREITLPPDFAFGASGALPFVAPNATLLLRIRVIRVESQPPPR